MYTVLPSSCPILAQFMKWAVMQEILKLLYRTAQFMNWTLRVSCYCPFHELGIRGSQFMNWAISQIGRNIYLIPSFDLYIYVIEPCTIESECGGRSSLVQPNRAEPLNQLFDGWGDGPVGEALVSTAR